MLHIWADRPGENIHYDGEQKTDPRDILLAGYDIFILEQNYQGLSIKISFYEIYYGKLYDLLNERKFLTKIEDVKQNICIRLN